jgi:hypothetical protein
MARHSAIDPHHVHKLVILRYAILRGLIFRSAIRSEVAWCERGKCQGDDNGNNDHPALP